MDPRQINRIAYFILATLFLSGIVLIFNTQTSFGGADAISHYLKAHWGWKYQNLLFNHWGKPPFTILASPFAQFGLNGVRLYNLILGFGTTILVWRLANRALKLHINASSMVFVLFTPLYFILMFSTLTEVTFSFFLALSVFLFFKNKYFLSAIVLSFLPLLRNEGIILIPSFILAFSLKKQFFYLPFFTSGFWLISLLGYPYYDDFFWLITKMPYSTGAKDIYGSGSLFHFIYNTPYILGYPIAAFFIVGLVYTLVRWFVKEKRKLSNTFYFILLIPGSYLIFLSAHSFVWWRGIGNSLGLLRVMGAVTPFAALTAMVGFDYLLHKIKDKHKLLAHFTNYLVLSYIIYLGIVTYQGGFRVPPTIALVDKAGDYLLENNLDRHMLYYYDPHILIKMDRDPYDLSMSRCCMPDNANIGASVPDSSILIWDAHFGPNEGQLALSVVKESEDYTLLKVFRPRHPFKVLGGYDYAVYIFQKLPKKQRVKDPNGQKCLFRSDFDFENPTYSGTNIAYTGKQSREIKSEQKYINLIEMPVKQLSPARKPFKVVFSAAVYTKEENKTKDIVFISTQDEHNKNLLYETYTATISPANSWSIIKYTFKVWKVPSETAQFKFYILNKDHSNFYLDDVHIMVTQMEAEY